jgi:hypothetical protein
MSRVRKYLSYFRGTPNVLCPVIGREAEIPIETVSEDVAVQQYNRYTS